MVTGQHGLLDHRAGRQPGLAALHAMAIQRNDQQHIQPQNRNLGPLDACILQPFFSMQHPLDGCIALQSIMTFRLECLGIRQVPRTGQNQQQLNNKGGRDEVWGLFLRPKVFEFTEERRYVQDAMRRFDVCQIQND